MNNSNIGKNVIVGENVFLGKDVIIRNNCIIEDNVEIRDGTYIDNNCLIRGDTIISERSTIGANCIIGEYQNDFMNDHVYHKHSLSIGKKAVIRSDSIIYSGSVIGDYFQTGHHVTIREKTVIGNNVSIGTLSDIQGRCNVGNYVRMHSNVHVGTSSKIDDCCWIYPYAVLTNDPNPPSEIEIGAHIHPFAIVATGAIILPGIDIQSDSLIGAGSVVTRDVKKYQVVVGNPAREHGDIRDIKNAKTGENHYPWRYYFDRNMPWKDFGFNEWYADLEDDVKRMLLG